MTKIIKNLIFVAFTSLVSIPFVKADVLPYYDKNQEKLVGIEMIANVSDFPDRVFFQVFPLADFYTFEMIDDKGVMGCNSRSNYIEQLWAVNLHFPEERPTLIEEANFYATQIGILNKENENLHRLCNEALYAGLRDCEQREEMETLRKKRREEATKFQNFLIEKGAVRLFSGQIFWELGCRENEVVKKSYIADKVVTISDFTYGLRPNWSLEVEVKINHLTITPEMLKDAEKIEPIINGINDPLNKELIDLPLPENKIQGFWEKLRSSIVCFFKGLFDSSC